MFINVFQHHFDEFLHAMADNEQRSNNMTGISSNGKGIDRRRAETHDSSEGYYVVLLLF